LYSTYSYSLVIWDQCYLPRDRGDSQALTMAILIYRSQKEERPRWLVIPRWFTRP